MNYRSAIQHCTCIMGPIRLLPYHCTRPRNFIQEIPFRYTRPRNQIQKIEKCSAVFWQLIIGKNGKMQGAWLTSRVSCADRQSFCCCPMVDQLSSLFSVRAILSPGLSAETRKDAFLSGSPCHPRFCSAGMQAHHSRPGSPC